MNKSELIAVVSEQSGLSKSESERALNAVIDAIQTAVAAGDEVRLVGFGSFGRKHKGARVGRNPKTGEPADIPAKAIPRFVAGSVFKQTVASAAQ